ncbi:MAG: hypothetical protein KAG43_04630, partial [Candidatus Marithrix sp.]|nr:hypothetical protein [Candidatus Marithrix sp.]
YAQNWLDDASVWKQVLALYLNLGITQGELGHIEKEIKAYEQGLDYAQNWLDDASVWELVLKSYNNLNHIGSETISLQYFPIINFLLWQVELDKDDEIAVIENQNNNLYYLSSPSNITNYFHNFTQQLITKFHNPDKPHRHLSTDQLLRLSEGLYLINALQERYPLHNAYTKLALLTKLEAAWQTEIGQPFSNCLQTALPAWQQIFPNTNFPLQAETPSISQLEQQVKDLSWYKHLWYRSQVKTLRQASQTSQAILDLDIKFKMRRLHPWHKMLTETNEALIEWLKFGILNYLPLPTGLSDRASVMLGIIFVYGKPDPLDNNWLSNIELVINAVRKSKILDWANGSEKKRLNSWLDKQTILMRNKLAIEISGQEQDTEEWRNTENMLINIKVAYASIQPQIEPLARIFTALKQDNLTTPIDKILETNSIDSDSRKLAIESLICGTSQRELSTAISKWLHKNGNIRCFNVSTAITKNQQNFERISQIYPLTWTQTNWDEQVNKWTKILIQETLATNNITKLWEILERTRIGFTSTTKANSLITWSEKTGLALKTAFEESINTRKKNKPNPNEPWPPLIAWSQALDTLIPTPPTIAECQAKLDDSALIQLFLDEQNLSALWLDQ